MDNIFPVTYGLMYITWLSFLFKPIAEKTRWFNLFPLTMVVFDWLENMSLANIAEGYLQNNVISDSAVQTASVFSIAKWVASVIISVAIIVGIVFRIRRFFKSRQIKSA